MRSTPSDVVDCFCRALLSVLQQTHCALVACDSKRVTIFLQGLWVSTQMVYLHRCLVVTRGVFTSLFGCYKRCVYIDVWLLQEVCLHRCLVVTWLVPLETAAISARSVYTIQPCIISRHFMQIHIRKVHACLAVISHLHVCQKVTGIFFFFFFLRATAVTRGWNGYRSKSQRRRLTLEKKKNLPPLLPGLEPEIFGSRVRSSNHWAIATPRCGSEVPGHTFVAGFFYFFPPAVVLTVQLWRRSDILAHCLSKFLQSKNVI